MDPVSRTDNVVDWMGNKVHICYTGNPLFLRGNGCILDVQNRQETYLVFQNGYEYANFYFGFNKY